MKKLILYTVLTTIGIELLVFACWAFVVMDVREPFETTFNNSDGRLVWLIATIIVAFHSLVGWMNSDNKR